MSYEITDNIDEFVKEAIEHQEKNRRPIMLAGAEVFQNDLERNTPVGIRRMSDRRASKNVTISNLRTDRETFEKYIAIGFKKGVSHRVHTTEFGTMYQRPQGFITKTYKESQRNAFSAMLAKARELN